MDVPIEEVLDAPCGPKTRHRGRIGRWAGLTEPQFFGMAGPASSLRPSSSSPTSARRSRSVRDAEEDTEFSRHKSRRPSRTPRRSLRPFRGEIRLSANGRSTGGWQDRISAAVGGTCRCEERRGSSAHPRGAVRHRREWTAEGKGLVHAPVPVVHPPVPLGSPGSSVAVREHDMLEAARRARLVRGLAVAAVTDSRPNLWLRAPSAGAARSAPSGAAPSHHASLTARRH